MTTPEEPTAESNGPTGRVQPPRAFPWEPGVSGRAPGGDPRPPRPVAQPAPSDEPTVVTTTQNGRPAPGLTPPQREPQSNLHRPGEAPVAGRPNPIREQAAAAARRDAQRAKVAGIDGPTRHIARPELSKDMPDLSEVRHPTPGAEAEVAERPAVATAVAAGKPLRATVQLRRIDPWSTLKVSLVISVALFFVWMVAVGLLYIVLDGMGVWDRLNNAFTDIVTESSSDGLVSAGQIFGYAAGIGVINIVLFTGLATVGAFIYNQCSDLVGGIEVTLADPD